MLADARDVRQRVEWHEREPLDRSMLLPPGLAIRLPMQALPHVVRLVRHGELIRWGDSYPHIWSI